MTERPLHRIKLTTHAQCTCGWAVSGMVPYRVAIGAADHIELHPDHHVVVWCEEKEVIT